MAMIEYVTGLTFSPDFDDVALVEKDRPDFLAGRLCAIGGHREKTDLSAEQATSREVNEEAGLLILPEAWVRYAHVAGRAGGADYVMHCFYAVTPRIQEVRTLTSEPIRVLKTAEVLQMCMKQPHRVAKDLTALIGHAFNVREGGKPAEIRYP
jgi:8-oxo-dGTP pyrophosphatase MutT (NUDIX family)